MESFIPFGTDPEMATRVADLIWDQAVMNFGLTDNEILLPLNITGIIGPLAIERLKLQLTNFLSRPCTAFADNALGCVRILASPEFKGLGPATDNMVLPRVSAEGGFSLDVCSIKSLQKADKKVEKRLKIPRPPNAFILYRKHYHAILKEQNPDMHNNEISIAVGIKWNNESSEVKAHYKALADEAKRQHAQKYPNYQYAPRKHCEKKRRNSRRTAENFVDYETFSDDEEESSLQTSYESPADSSTYSAFSGQDQDDFAEQTVEDQTMDDYMTLSPIFSPLNESYHFSDYDIGDYNSWVRDAAMAQRLTIIAHTHAENGSFSQLFPPSHG
ncbi:mating type protein MAT1-2-1 [Talaromyces stipitatus ATCC 10500]|uniref:Mating type protein MAT1-2-1 n=1 Tax=Talaromyces stipitatus (strain ATCC 10500 / CBS 375.48 / QM 6759 / NRRL 1006) TaxID=441959 RepID=B8MVA1_TALSN|nr:mating type protein MAT1-2-1 [Talaromyces stipitatus ATCC 10500]EED11557.1 mating type protein MAT1-2-1 [Talaromyces stipitatus ATCC 10500]